MRLVYLGAALVAAAQLVGCAKGDDAIGGSAGAGAVAGFGGTNPEGGGAVGGAAGGGSGGVGNVGNTGGTGNVGNTGGTAGAGGCTPPVSGGTCDTFPQCGCQSGEACIATVPMGVTQCTADGTVDPYEPCDATKLCKAGYACVGTACKQYCDQGADCASGSCFQVQYDNGGTPTPVPQMKVCASGCALENPGAICGAGLGCYANSDTPPVTDCAPAGSGKAPGDCTAPTQADATLCAPGYGCVLPDPNDKTIGDCRKWCRIGFTSDCPSGGCTGFQTPFFVDGLEYGVCP